MSASPSWCAITVNVVPGVLASTGCIFTPILCAAAGTFFRTEVLTVVEGFSKTPRTNLGHLSEQGELWHNRREIPPSAWAGWCCAVEIGSGLTHHEYALAPSID